MLRRAAITAVGLAVILVLPSCGGGDGGGPTSTVKVEGGQSKAASSAPSSPSSRPNRPPVQNVVPQATKSTPPPFGASGQGIAPRFSASGPQDLNGPITSVIQNVAQFWATNFANSNRSWTYPNYQIAGPGDEIPTNCGPAGNPDEFPGQPNVEPQANPAFYCGGTWNGSPVTQQATVYLSSQWLYDHVYNQEGSPADFAVAFAIAHEMGHAVQDQLGYFGTQGAQCCGLQTFQTELQADCFGGVWANSAYNQRILEPGDPEEGAGAAYDVGDYFFWDVGHHGTPDERQNAEIYGYNQGDPSKCGVDLVNLPTQQIGG